MILLGYLLGSTALNLILGFLVQFKSYRGSLRAVLLILSGLFTAQMWAAYMAVFSDTPERWFHLHRIKMALGLASAVGLLELARHFLRGGEDEPGLNWGRRRVSLVWLAAAAAAAAGILLFIPGMAVPGEGPGILEFRFRGAGVAVPAVRVLLAVYALYLLEGTYRYAQDYQRRIGRLCFIGMGVLAIFHVISFSRVLLYDTLPEHHAEASSVVYGVVYPVVLAGFLRYRLGSERITVPRDTVYTSATIFLIGSVFLGVALTVLAFHWLSLDFAYFERFLVGFSLCFLAVLVLGSGTMRRRISRFVDQQFYSRKYDYQEQFFRLHRAGLSGGDVDSAVIELVENMKYSVAVDDAHFFLLDWQDGDFYQKENKEEATRRGLVIGGDSPLARQLAATRLPVDLLDRGEAQRAAREAVLAEPLARELRVDAVFPVAVGDRLGGILALKGGRNRPFDAEDLALIGVFASAIGDALFKNRVLKERIEQKQFESFHHVASFIIHDIKNQVATLNLLMKNAERNLSNPSFQASMMSSIRSCAQSLQGLIDRLSVAPRRQDAAVGDHPLGPLLEEVAANAGLASLPGLALETAGEPRVAARMDRQALFFVVRNLVNNALEAMGGKGRLRISHGSLASAVPGRLRELFGGGRQIFSNYGAWVLVEDSGTGMDPDFVRRRLFQPFATTKEKGVGIGLYQCKTLVERMGGRILCHSEPGKGTEFCILLPGAGGPEEPEGR
jgi:putative PEP-CTERM system histidine kinase